LEEIPQEVLSRLRMHFVDAVDDVLAIALEGGIRTDAATARLARSRTRRSAAERRATARS
jgi:pilus assembly protein TadC